MRDEHLAPYGSAGRQQIPPETGAISTVEQTEEIPDLGRAGLSEAFERGEGRPGDHALTRAYSGRSEGQEGPVALAVENDPPALVGQPVDGMGPAREGRDAPRARTGWRAGPGGAWGSGSKEKAPVRMSKEAGRQGSSGAEKGTRSRRPSTTTGVPASPAGSGIGPATS